MKIVILCGGLGSRLGSETKKRPKPMVKIQGLPILTHILNIYKKCGFNDFIIALGYKGDFIRKYYKNNREFKLKLINTGQKTLTGGRLLKLKKHLLTEDNFMLTYGDGVADVNLKKLLNFHKKHKKIASMTVVRPTIRFGEVKIKRNLIYEFKEKPQIKKGWINGGFFVFNSKIFKYLKSYNEMLENKPLEKLSKNKQLMAFKHSGFWQCMDTNRDKELLQKLLKSGKAPWLK